MSFGITVCSVQARILARILVSTFISKIGWYKSHSLGSLPPLGIKTTIASHIDDGKLPSSLTELKTCSNLGATKSLNVPYHSKAKLSNSRDLQGEKEAIAPSTSSTVIYLSTIAKSSSDSLEISIAAR